jgi:NADH:ubiquinone oxidoreductase subunit E
MTVIVEQEKCSGLASREEKLFVLRQMVADYAGRGDDLVPILRMAHSVFGYLTYEVQNIIAEVIDVPVATIAGTIAFEDCFTDFRRGHNVVQVCVGMSCYNNGGKELLKQLREELGIEVGETTEDGKFSLEVTECFGECTGTPAIMINGTVYQDLKPDGIAKILSRHE